jgi:hypothetical protein
LGLGLGILAVIVGQVVALAYHWLHVKKGAFGPATEGVQKSGPPPHDFGRSLVEHLSQPEGFVMLGGYLVGTWMMRWMPPTYYDFEGGIDWGAVALQLLLQDVIQFAMHLGEHKVTIEHAQKRLAQHAASARRRRRPSRDTRRLHEDDDGRRTTHTPTQPNRPQSSHPCPLAPSY